MPTSWAEIWPIPFFIGIAVAAVVSILAGMALQWFLNQDHRSYSGIDALGKFARANGWETLKKDDPRRGDQPPLSLFRTRDPMEVENRLFKREGAVDAFLFNFARKSSGGELSTTVIAFRFDDPELDLEPFRMTPAEGNDFPYAVVGDLLNGAARARFQRRRGWCVEASGRWIIFYRPLQTALPEQLEVRRNPLEQLAPEGGRVPVQELPRFVDDAWELLALLHEPGTPHQASIDPTQR